MSIKNSAYSSDARDKHPEGLRILMADDDPQEHILMVMASEGISTPLIFDFVSDGAKLLTELYVPESAKDLPNLIILDLRMPRLDGLRTLEELQAHPLFWQVPVIVFTSSARIQDEALSYARGATLFMTKPSSFSGMEAFLERAIEIAKSTDEYDDVPVFDETLDVTDTVDVRKRIKLDAESEQPSELGN